MRTCGLCLMSVVILSFAAVRPAVAAPNAEQRKELAEIRKNLGEPFNKLLREKKIDEAAKLVADAEARFTKVVMDAKLTNRDAIAVGLARYLQSRKVILLKLQKANPKTAGVSFEKQVAPIFKTHCSRCHANNPKGGLDLSSVAGFQKGGDNGALVVAGNPAVSLLMKRLTATGNERMPQGGRALSATELQTIALWINQGAKFEDGKTVVKSKEKTAPPKIEIAMATGKETVSFSKDIAPFMVNLCLNCHNDRRKSGGLSIETFEKMMIGGKSGRVVIAGNTDASRMWDLVGKQQPFKMPRGQALITRSNHRNLRVWIEEGAKFDGKDPKATLRSLVPSEEDLKAERFAKMTPTEFAQFRQKRTEELWKKVLSKDTPRFVESKEFFVYGNVSAARLTEVDKWAQEHADRLRKLFRDKSSLLFKGKLAIIVMKDRFGYEEFNQVIQRREVPKEMTGHSVITSNLEDAYIVVQDIGDGVSETSAGMKVNVIDQLTGIFLTRGGDKLPDWVLRGTGLAMAAQTDPKNAYIVELKNRVPGLLQNVTKPESLFANGTFSPADVGAVGYALVDFMLRGGGGVKFGQYISTIQKGSSATAALKSVYQTDAAPLARNFARSLPRKR